ncbi:MAG: methyltransferase domain-containing protein [Verrucomicrobia bacterium]|nr:methyltransferase domain-containing protein [Verrucomicrobiota bacterium]
MLSTLSTYFHFFWAGAVNHNQTGGIVPSQRFLIAKMIAPIPKSHRGPIVELGAGTGAITARLAAKCAHSKILACELNPTLAQVNRDSLARAGIRKHVEVITGSAENLLAELASKGKTRPVFIVSGIPLANLGRAKTQALVEGIWRALAEGGLFIQFQHSLISRQIIRSRFPQLRTVPVWLNFPPAVVYYASRGA